MIIENTQTSVEIGFKNAPRDHSVTAVAQTLAKMLPVKTGYYCFDPYKAMIPGLGAEKFFTDIYPADETGCYDEQGVWSEELWEASIVGSVVLDSKKQFKDIILPAIKELVDTGVWTEFKVRYLDECMPAEVVREIVFS